MSDTTILEGPDGRLYEIPTDQLAAFAVPGERVSQLRRRMVERASSDAATPGNDAAAPALPPGHAALPPGHAALPPGHAASAPGAPSMSFQPTGGVVLNFYFQTPVPTPEVRPAPTAGEADNSVAAYHMDMASGIPINHTDMLWGDYIDKQGKPAIGWHSHDPVTGNAQ